MVVWLLLGADKTGRGHSGWRGQALIRSRGQRVKLDRGRPTNRSKASMDAAAE